MIKFKDYGYRRASTDTQKLRELFHQVTKKRLQKPQLERIQDELEAGGYPDVDHITDRDIYEYVMYKKVYPRTPISKKNLELAKKEIERYPVNELISAKEIYQRVVGFKNSILGEYDLPNSTFYYWFERLNIKFSVKGNYPTTVASMIFYAAYSHDITKAYSRDKEGKFTTPV